MNCRTCQFGNIARKCPSSVMLFPRKLCVALFTMVCWQVCEAVVMFNHVLDWPLAMKPGSSLQAVLLCGCLALWVKGSGV